MLRNSNRANSRRERTNKKKGSRSKGIKLREWSDESMLGAIQAVREGTFGVNRAALEYGVPKTTLKDRISGKGSARCQYGSSALLIKGGRR